MLDDKAICTGLGNQVNHPNPNHWTMTYEVGDNRQFDDARCPGHRGGNNLLWKWLDEVDDKFCL